MDPQHPAAKRPRLDNYWPNIAQEHAATSLVSVRTESEASLAPPYFNERFSNGQVSVSITEFEKHCQTQGRHLTYVEQPATIWCQSTSHGQALTSSSLMTNTSQSRTPIRLLPVVPSQSVQFSSSVHIQASCQPYPAAPGQISASSEQRRELWSGDAHCQPFYGITNEREFQMKVL